MNSFMTQNLTIIKHMIFLNFMTWDKQSSKNGQMI